jgi:transcriptional regulator with XRE-family HTH domain
LTKKKLSLFASRLAVLLDCAGSFSRQDWAEILGVTPSAVSQWLQDDTIPRASTLRRIVEVAERHCEGDALEKFREILSMPSTKVSPRGKKMAPTVAHYMVEPIREGFLRVLAPLTPKDQESVLFEAAARCHALIKQQFTDFSKTSHRRASIEPKRGAPAAVPKIERRTQCAAAEPVPQNVPWKEPV